MPHTYTFREQVDGSWKITQHAMQGGTYQRDATYPDVALALIEPGETRINRISYAAPAGPSVEDRKITMIEAAKQATKDAFNAGFEVEGKVYDFCGGERAAENWLGYNNMCSDVLIGAVPAENLSPAYTKTGEALALNAAQGKALFYTLGNMRIALAASEVQKIAQINACTTHQELDALGA